MNLKDKNNYVIQVNQFSQVTKGKWGAQISYNDTYYYRNSRLELDTYF